MTPPCRSRRFCPPRSRTCSSTPNMGIAVGMASQHLLVQSARGLPDGHRPDQRPRTQTCSNCCPRPISRPAARSSTTRRRCCKIYNTGRGSFRVRARWRYVREGNLIEIYEIPYTTTTEAIIDKVAELVKAGKIREIADMRDETDLNGLKLTIDLKRGVDPEKLMQKLFKSTHAGGQLRLQLQHPHRGHAARAGRARNFRGVDRMAHGVRPPPGLLRAAKEEGTSCICSRVSARSCSTSTRPSRIIRETETDAEVVPNLMIGFGIDQVQAEYVAEIKLRNINKEFLLNRIRGDRLARTRDRRTGRPPRAPSGRSGA